MTTQTLTKARPSGANERRGPSEQLPPAVIYPAKQSLAIKAAEFERAEQDLEDYRAKTARAQRDESEALESAQLSEQEAAEAIGRAQNLRNVYLSRTASKEKAIAALTPELASAINAAGAEFRGLQGQELHKRKEIITARVLEKIEPVADGSRRDQAIALLLEHSGPVQKIVALGWVSHIYTKDDTGLLLTARALLEKFDQLTVEMGREI